MHAKENMSTNSHSNEEILRAAQDVDAWCKLKFDKNCKRESLRQQEIFPQLLVGEHKSVDGVIVQRRAELRIMGITPTEKYLKGKYLVFSSYQSMSDCLPEENTEGFFDVNDCPPWGLWVGYKEPNYLICWVPEYLYELVEIGLSHSSCDPFWWLDEMNELWAVQLKNA